MVVEKTHHGLQRCHLLQADCAKEQVRNLECQVTDVAAYSAPVVHRDAQVVVHPDCMDLLPVISMEWKAVVR